MDLITYIGDLEAFRLEALYIANDENHPAHIMVDLDGEVLIFNKGLHVPVIYNGNMSVALCRTDTPEAIDGTMENLEVIGECIKNDKGQNEYKFRPYGEDKCYSVYSPPEGESKLFGVFA